jgi:hypothetical protein
MSVPAKEDKMRHNCTLRGFAALVVAALATGSQAWLVGWDTLPWNEYDHYDYWRIEGVMGSDRKVAGRFQSFNTGRLGWLTFAIDTASSYGVNVNLYKHINDESWVLLDSWYDVHGTGPVTVMAGTDAPWIIQGSFYWLELKPASDNTDTHWFYNNIGYKSTVLVGPSVGNYVDHYDMTIDSPAFRVALTDPAASPEPTTLLPLAIGLILSWRRRRAV